MKPSGISKIKIVAGVFLFHFLVSFVFYFVVVPLLAPADAAIPPSVLADLQLNYALVGFLVATATTIAVVLILLYALEGNASLREVADSIRQPLLLIDDGNRYAMINKEAEAALGLSMDRDAGKPVDQAIKNALAAGRTREDVIDMATVIERGGRRYQVVDNPLPGGKDAGERQRIVALKDVTADLRIVEAVRDINHTMLVVNANTMKISNSSISLSQGATEQAGSLSSISTSLDEFSRKVQGNTESAAKGTQLAAQAREAAERSGSEIANALSAMTDVQDAGIRIARIVKLIDDIAFQTNLLALNAAVEAARAGRQGKGFAVVADEVRNLAGRSAKAAKDTALMVEDVTERIGNASAYISRLEEMLRNIMQDAVRMADSSAASSTTSAEQAAAILQLNQELGQMTSLTQGTMSAAEQTATAVEVLTRQVDGLKRKLDGLAGEFRVDGQLPLPSINLTDAPESLSGPPSMDAYGHPGQRVLGGYDARAEDRDFEAPFRAAEWNLDADANAADTTLSSLLQSDGYNEDYRNFLDGASKPANAFGDNLGGIADDGQDYRTTPDGDRVVKPGQNIRLDDSEFGRY